MRLRGTIGLSGPYDVIPFAQQPYPAGSSESARTADLSRDLRNGPAAGGAPGAGEADSTVDPGNTSAWRERGASRAVKPC